MNTMTKPYSRLAKSFLKTLAEEGKQENLVFSPLSVYTLLAVAADAAAGKTGKEIQTVLCGRNDPDRILRELSDVQNNLASGGQYSSASAVAVRADFRAAITPGYPERLRDLFGGELFAVEDMAAAINAWVSRRTKGMIRELADDTVKEMLLCLMNACAFEAEWRDEYEETQVHNMDFRNADGTTSRVPMLKSDESTYIENGHFIGFAKPYKGNQFFYAALLPKKQETVTGKMIDSIDFSSLLTGRKNTVAHVLMPEFKCASYLDLTDICKAHGIRTVFTPQADFSPLSGTWLKADAVRHRAAIEVDRKGTKAAAVTCMDVTYGAFPREFPEIKEVILDRPFLYAVMHNETGLPVFLGVVNRLEPAGDRELYPTDEEKDALCKPVYDRVCGVILDEDGLVKEQVGCELWYQVFDAYERLDYAELRRLEKSALKEVPDGQREEIQTQ